MIALRPQRPTDYRAIEPVLQQCRSGAALRAFYDAYCDRYLALDAQYHFTETFERDLVMEQLDEVAREPGAALFGIPVGVKDVFNTARLPTSMGSELWKGFRPGNNARVVYEIAERGAVIFSKTTTAEFAVHYIQAGRTINPHHAGHITGTSSAGSAVAVACGALPVALGTQTGASIIRPASFCGTFGFKPSFGAFDRTGTLKTTDTLDTIGLLGSDIHGLRRVFMASFQQEPQYPFARKYFTKWEASRTRRTVRVGIVSDQFEGYAAYDPTVQTDFRTLCAKLDGPGISISKAEGIDCINQIHALHEHIYSKALSYYFQAEFSRGTHLSEIMGRMIETGSRVSTEDYLHALREQPKLRARFDELFGNYDFLVTPSTGSAAPVLGQDEIRDTGLVWTFLGYPALSVPLFVHPDSGLPFGLQIVAPKFCDLALLDFAESLLESLSDR